MLVLVIAEVVGQRGRHVNLPGQPQVSKHQVLWSGLQQQHRLLWVFAEAVGEDAACRPCSDYDIAIGRRFITGHSSKAPVWIEKLSSFSSPVDELCFRHAGKLDPSIWVECEPRQRLSASTADHTGKRQHPVSRRAFFIHCKVQQNHKSSLNEKAMCK